MYFRNCYDLDTNFGDILLKDFAVKDIPDILNRCSPGGSTNDSVLRVFEMQNGITSHDTAHNFDRYRYVRGSWGSSGNDGLLLPMVSDVDATVYNSTTDKFIHNSGAIVSTEDSQKGRIDNKWISNNGADHICPTARGDEQSYLNLVQHISDKAIKALKMFPRTTSPVSSYISITGEDSSTNCTCEACQIAFEDDCKTYAGAYLRLCEDVADRVYEMMDELGWGEDDPRRRD